MSSFRHGYWSTGNCASRPEPRSHMHDAGRRHSALAWAHSTRTSQALPPAGIAGGGLNGRRRRFVRTATRCSTLAAAGELATCAEEERRFLCANRSQNAGRANLADRCGSAPGRQSLRRLPRRDSAGAPYRPIRDRPRLSLGHVARDYAALRAASRNGIVIDRRAVCFTASRTAAITRSCRASPSSA